MDTTQNNFNIDSIQLDGILVINARHLTDRMESISKQLHNISLPFEFIHTFDVSDISDEISKQYFGKASDLRNSQKSCALKHHFACKLIVERQWKNALILEDDAILADAFLAGLSLAVNEAKNIPAPKVIFLGSGGNFFTPKSQRKTGQHLYRATKGRFADAYIIDAQSAKLRFEWVEQNGINVSIDNLYDQIDPLLNIKLYWYEDPIVEQGSKNGLFTSDLEALPPLPIQKLLFMLEKFRRKYLYQIWR